jgi:GR25 family glycosyltransferase involved in LPS biosynthesis
MTDGEVNSGISAFVLGLKSQFRGKDLVTQLADSKVDVKIVWGLEVDKFEKNFLNSLVDNRKSRYILGRRLSFGEVSCALGHLEMYEEFLLTNKEWGLFLEDDAIVETSFEAVLKNLPNDLPPSIISLTSAQDERFEPRPFPFLVNELRFGDDYIFRQCAIAPVLAHAYLMNRVGALRATHLLRGKKIYSPADFPFQFRNHFDFYVSDGGYVISGVYPSTLEEDRLTEIVKGKQSNWKINLKRKARVLFDYSGMGVFVARIIGLSARDYVDERIHLRGEYKKFLKGDSKKFTR